MVCSPCVLRQFSDSDDPCDPNDTYSKAALQRPLTAGPLIDLHYLIDVRLTYLSKACSVFTLGIMEPASWYRSLDTITCLTGIWVRVAFSEQKTFLHLSFANQFSVFGTNCPLLEIDLSVLTFYDHRVQRNR